MPVPLATPVEIRLVELAYLVERGAHWWLSEVCKLLNEIAPDSDGFVQEFAYVDGERRVTGVCADDPELTDGLYELNHSLSEVHRRALEAVPLSAGTTRELFANAGIPFEFTTFAQCYDRLNIHDLFGVSALDPSGQGVVFGMTLRDRAGPAPSIRARLVQVGAHLAAGARLRHKLDGALPEDAAEAIVRTDGKLEHLARADAVDREILSEAVKRVERARVHTRDPDEALALWQALVDGRWSLVDRFEGDGRCYYVAIANRPEVAQVRSLSRREAEVVAYAAAGTDTKSIAYALGLNPVTVRRYLSAAMAKLGVNSRAELIRLRALLLGRDKH